MLEPQDLPGRFGCVVRALDHLLVACDCESVVGGICRRYIRNMQIASTSFSIRSAGRRNTGRFVRVEVCLTRSLAHDDSRPTKDKANYSNLPVVTQNAKRRGDVCG
ncbi:MAG TPA: hypothetical protein VGM76_11745 [Lacipirellulaceae bacterium]|jgi:hypothetical protein